MRNHTLKKIPNTRLIEERKHRQWSQQEVADRIGTTQHNVSRWERGVSSPGPYFRHQLSVLFGQSAEALGLLPALSIEAAEGHPCEALRSPCTGSVDRR